MEQVGKTVTLAMSVWYNEETGHIHLAVPASEGFVTTVNGEATSKRGHPNLYRKLALALREQGRPAPDIVVIEAD